jgi:hypothetical protein
MKKLILLLVLTMSLLFGMVSISPREHIILKKDIERVWHLKCHAYPDTFLFFSYVTSEGKGYCLKAVMVYENKYYYRLIGGVGLHKDIKKSEIDGLFIIGVGYRN